VAVVRHAAVDWFRHRDGRHRLSQLAQELPSHQRRIFELVFLDHRSHSEAFELLNQEQPGLVFRVFLAELRATYRAVVRGRRGQLLRELGPPPLDSSPDDPYLPIESTERRERLQAALDSLTPEDRLTAQLYVIDGLPAGEVATVLGLPNAKAVYNRVYRILAELRAGLERSGIRHGDL
jgi:DNA-directed RNA polymerase specialized sigma24 family protein